VIVGEVTVPHEEQNREKRLAAEAAAQLVAPGMMVGLGTGTTVAYLLPALAARALDVTCVATSPATEARARQLGLEVRPFEHIDHLDIAIDGADQVGADGWLIKGGGGAHTREKIVAAAADRFVVIVSSDKLVERLHPPVPLEIIAFGEDATLLLLGHARLRPATPRSPEGGLIADWHGPIDNPAALADQLATTPGVIEHGLFPPSMVSDVVIGRRNGTEHRPA
jgi:ribose 5-phosphate isomerase A